MQTPTLKCGRIPREIIFSRLQLNRLFFSFSRDTERFVSYHECSWLSMQLSTSISVQTGRASCVVEPFAHTLCLDKWSIFPFKSSVFAPLRSALQCGAVCLFVCVLLLTLNPTVRHIYIISLLTWSYTTFFPRCIRDWDLEKWGRLSLSPLTLPSLRRILRKLHGAHVHVTQSYLH